MNVTPSRLFRALSDATRLRAMLLLHNEGELCVCELTHALRLSQPKVSRHLANLRAGGLVADRRQGQWIHYRLHPELPAWARQTLATVARAEAAGRTLDPDRARLTRMPNRPPMRCSA